LAGRQGGHRVGRDVVKRDDQVDALHRRYTQEYGQRPEGM